MTTFDGFWPRSQKYRKLERSLGGVWKTRIWGSQTGQSWVLGVMKCMPVVVIVAASAGTGPPTKPPVTGPQDPNCILLSKNT